MKAVVAFVFAGFIAVTQGCGQGSEADVSAVTDTGSSDGGPDAWGDSSCPDEAAAEVIRCGTSDDLPDLDVGSSDSDAGPDGGSSNRFGVIQGRMDPTLITDILTDLGAGWMRMNVKLDGKDVDLSKLLAAGVDVVITVSNENPANADGSACGCAPGGKGCERAAFPYKSRTVYQDDVRKLLSPLVPYVASGRRLMVQCENEVVPEGAYWCGDEKQYLDQLGALHEAVKSVEPSIPVVMTSFATRTLDAIIDPSNPSHAGAVALANLFLTQGVYDAVDLHFYGCVQDIAAKATWFNERLAPGKLWISTENGGPDYRCAADKGFQWPDPDESAWEAEQAAQVPARLGACADNGGEVCLWFSLFDMSGEDTVFAHLGLMEPTPPYRKKPAYEAFKAFTASQK